jgi:hypothetical protein
MPEARTIDPKVLSRKNNTGTDIAKGVYVMADSTEEQVKLPTGTTVALLGVTMEVIKNGYYGDVQYAGVARVKAGGALATPGTKLMAKTDGKAQAWSAGGGVAAQNGGIMLNSAAAEDDMLEVLLPGPGIVEQGA